jgi:phosphoglycerate dehydrogenase-like enzyme
MRRGAWTREAFIGVELEGRTLGIVGLGNIGTRVARHARGFGMRVLASDPEISEQDAAERGAILVAFDTLLRESDVISLHPRLTVTTRRLIDGMAIEKMKPGVRIVNTSRGQVIDETALIDGLRSGHIAGAALDTFEEEPLDLGSPLRTMSNVILCPHIAGQTVESLRRMAAEAAQAILDELSGRTPACVFNPEAYLQRSKGRRPV